MAERRLKSSLEDYLVLESNLNHVIDPLLLSTKCAELRTQLSS